MHNRKNCGCNRQINKYVDVTNIDPIPWSDASALLGLDSCGNVVLVEMPDFVSYNEDGDIEAENRIILKNNANILGRTLSGGTVNLIECSKYTDEGHPIVDIGSTSAHITFSAVDRPNVQLQGESGNHDHQVAYLADIGLSNPLSLSEIIGRIGALESRVQLLGSAM